MFKLVLEKDEEIKGGYTTRMSFGFTVAKDTRTEERDEDNKVITILRTITVIKTLWGESAGLQMEWKCGGRNHNRRRGRPRGQGGGRTGTEAAGMLSDGCGDREYQ